MNELIKKECKNLYNRFIQKLRFSLTFKITLVYALKTISILMFLGICIIAGFVVFNGWNAQKNMKRNFYMVSDYLKDSPTSYEKTIQKVAQLDQFSITVFDPAGNILYSTEKDTTFEVFYNNEEIVGVWDINDHYMIVRDNDPTHYIGYSMILKEETRWNGNPVQIQIKSKMIKESTSLIIIVLLLIIVDIFLVLSVIASGAKSSRKILKPIESMTQTVENITINELNTRLDISGSQDELKDLARTFNNMLDRIQKSYEQQNQFVSDASHELRTPIAVIQGYTDLLDRWGKKDESILEESLTAIKEESENMKELVEKLLFLARGDKNTQKIEKKYFYLNKLIDEIVKETRIIDEDHNIQNPQNDEVEINADPRLIKECLRIFIDNCIKYTPKGGEIKIESIDKENKVQILIQDTGIGIPKEDLPYILNRFYRADKSRTKETGGTGLGLSIASWIIQKHSGTMTIESQVDVGTRVIINLPKHGG